jgi:hypothetical protein
LVELLVGKPSLESSAESGVANCFEGGGESGRFRERFSGRLLAEILFNQVDAFGMEDSTVEPSVSVSFVAQAKCSVRKGALEGVSISPARIIEIRQPPQCFERRFLPKETVEKFHGSEVAER